MTKCELSWCCGNGLLFSLTVLAAFSVADCGLLAQDTSLKSPSDVPVSETAMVKRVVLFNSGVAHITHGAPINDGQTIELETDRDQIDNVLKSLVFDDPDGTLKSVSYQPIENQSERDIAAASSPMTVAQILQLHRGESVTLQIDKITHTGTIVGVETRDLEDESVNFISLLNDDGLTTFALEDVDRFQFHDVKVRERFASAMRGVAKSQQSDGETVKLVCKGVGKRDLRFAYVIDAPVWRMSYRLDLEKENSVLQGWAHVDHVGRESWQDIQLVLQSGRPRVFHADVFVPMVSSRPHLGTSVFGLNGRLMSVENVLSDAMRPHLNTRDAWADTNSSELSGSMGFRAKGGGFGGGGMAGGGGMGGGGGGGGMGGGVGGMGGGRGTPGQQKTPGLPVEFDINRGFSSAADQGKVGQIVNFEVADPVTLENQASAMLPVFDQTLAAARETWFHVNSSSALGELVLQLTNESKYPLLAGPVAIYQSGVFLGDARLGRTEIGDNFELRYGLDEPVSLALSKTKTETKLTKMDLDEAKRIRIWGIETKTMKLKLKNQDSDPCKVVVLLPREGEHIKANPDPATTTENSFRYEFDVPGGQEISQAIAFTLPIQNSYRIRSKTRVQIAQWLESIDDISAPARALIDRYLDLDGEIRKLDLRRNQLSGKIDLLIADQERLIKLIDATEDGSANRELLLGRAMDAENQIQKMRKESVELRTQLKQLESNLSTLEPR